MKKLALLFTIFLHTLLAAQDVKFEAKVSKNSLGLNENLQISFAINQDGDNFSPPDFEGFRLVGGPFQSTSYSWINGVKSFNRSFTYILQPTKKGTFTIKSASIEFNDEIYKTAPIKITVTDAIPQPKDPNSPDYKAGEGIHLVAEVSKGNPYVNEPLTVVYKLYFDPRFIVRNVREVANPKYNGFWSQHIDIKKLEAVTGTYNGQDYAMVVWRKVILYPLEAGNKPLEPLSIVLDVDVPTRKRIGFMETTSYSTTQKTVSAGAKSINVKALPEKGKPQDFNGAVGNFDFSVKTSKTQLKAGESLDLTVTASGNGNLKLFQLPKPEFPNAFEVFDPQHKEEVNTPLSGMAGKISDTYTIIPQFKGKYTIKPQTFSYFDLSSNSYKTVTSEPIEITVLEGNAVASSTQNDSKKPVVKNDTFQYIKLTSYLTPINKRPFFGSNLFYGLLAAPFLLLPIIILARKKKKPEMPTNLETA